MKKDFIVTNKINMTDYSNALELIEKSKYILIVTHVNPDADSISSALALSNLFFEKKLDSVCFIILPFKIFHTFNPSGVGGIKLIG